MSLRDNKLEIAIVVVGLVLIGSVGNLFKAPVQRALQNNEISFEMIRPKSILAALFDLGGREVARNYVNPFGNKKPTEEAKTIPNTEDKTKSAAPNKTAQKKAEEKKPEDKKTETEIRVVGTDPGFKAGGSDGATGGAVGAAFITGGTTATDGNKQATDKDKLTANQWRSLVLGQPTKENVNKMVVAYMDKELNDSEFYGIVNELLKNSNTETQSLGLSAASSFYSSTAFNTVATNYKTLSTENQTAAMAYMLGFANAGRLSALASSLKNSDSEVVALAAEVVVKGYNSAKSGTTTSSTRSRGDAFANALTNYDQFREIFKALTTSSNAEIASAATFALSQIQSGVASL
ncbi:hypothetical protein B9G69_005430 [Bdellovibrio sp. SKB1291214]|uniref:hypothetical protein n=1 Tax=Bdellovibrio sp. SKB1291214 TaxID=1732569 RepID=UPI000B51547F|nr:hypothetical protein [Bdellovibrio sp. SKB1291214]UYL10017.1 hypothetical protein B9G69_005430 [Bdellovibrio sp. SKB1291214]